MSAPLDIDSIPLPWQIDAWQQLCTRLADGKLPHAVLIMGASGTGKERFASAFARLALCQQPQSQHACGHCPGCHQFRAGAHPDYFPVSIAEDRTAILVDQIRELAANLMLTSQHGGRKLALIAPADAMNAAAANSLLKTLEEPPAETFLLLVTARMARLPATVRSRCQQLRLPTPAAEMAQHWLDGIEARPDWAALLGIAGGGPLLALQLAQNPLLRERLGFFRLLEELRSGQRDPVASAKDLNGEEPQVVLRLMQSWIMDIITQRASVGSESGSVIHADALGLLQTAGQGIHLRALLAYLGRLNEALALIGTPVNARLLLESLLVEWADGLRTLEMTPLAARGGSIG